MKEFKKLTVQNLTKKKKNKSNSSFNNVKKYFKKVEKFCKKRKQANKLFIMPFHIHFNELHYVKIGLTVALKNILKRIFKKKCWKKHFLKNLELCKCSSKELSKILNF